MNREIKFRVRNKDTGEWLCRNGADLWVILSLFSSHPEGSAGSWEFYEYTGLKDKNGKEIYEGDIFDMGVVIFSQGCFNGCYISSSTKKEGWEYSDDWEDGLADYASKHEVKGNIYENPELLK